MKFAKLFDIEDNQLIIYKDTDDNDLDCIVLITETEVGLITQSHSYELTEKRDSMFESFDQAKAEEYIESIKTFLKSMEDKQQ